MQLITARPLQPVGLLLEAGFVHGGRKLKDLAPRRKQEICGKMVLRKQEVDYLGPVLPDVYIPSGCN